MAEGGGERSARDGTHAVFVSYASEDTEAVGRICEALREAGIEVWFDRSELRGGDLWDQTIRQRIHDCHLFIPVVSAHTEARSEGYFRREWKLAVDRTEDMAGDVAFLVPVVVDGTPSAVARVPPKFRDVQWTRLPDGQPTAAFIQRIRGLLVSRPSAGTQPGADVRGGAASVHYAAPAFPDEVRQPRAIRSAPVLIAAVIMALAAGYFAVDRFVFLKRAPPANAAIERSIAVLPFVDMSEKHDQEYFGDGMAEEILNTLVRIPGLKVIGRTSSFQFKGKADDLRSVGASLGANYVVEGSVRRSGDHMRVTAQLIDTRDGAHRWSQTYDRAARDAIAVQEEIAAALARALQVEVGAIPLGVHPRNNEAYDHYLRAAHAWDRQDAQGMSEAKIEYQRALDADPEFTPAAEGLAWVTFGLGESAFEDSGKAFPEARRAAQSVLKKDPSSAKAHVVLSRVALEYDWDWKEAERQAKAALGLEANNPYALVALSLVEGAEGRFAEAVQEADAAVATDPLFAVGHMVRNYAYVRARRLTEAEEAGRRVLEIAPTYAWAHYYLAQTLMMEGKLDDALDEAKKETVPMARDTMLVVVFAAHGRVKEAEAALTRLRSDEFWPMGQAYALIALNRNDEAFRLMDKAYETKDSDLYGMKGNPLLAKVEGDPRYKELLRKLRLPD